MIAGCDISTRHIDLCAIDPDNVATCEHRRVELPTPWWDAARTMRATLEPSYSHAAGSGPSCTVCWLAQRDVELLGIERPYGPHRQAIASLHTVLGALLAALPAHITVLEVRPQEMRRELGLPANASKERMHDAVYLEIGEQWNGNRPWPVDAYDAWSVAHAALRICERQAA